MDTIKFIKLVRDHPVLYDTTHEHYLSTKIKDCIWDQIATEVNIPDGKSLITTE